MTLEHNQPHNPARHLEAGGGSFGTCLSFPSVRAIMAVRSGDVLCVRGKDAHPMTETPNDDNPGFVGSEPEHCFACFRFICPGQTYYLTVDGTVLCEDCALTDDIVRVREDLVIGVKRDRLLIQRGEAEVEVFPGEIRHLVNALVEAAVRLVGQQT